MKIEYVGTGEAFRMVGAVISGLFGYGLLLFCVIMFVMLMRSIGPEAHRIAACPIHVTTTDSGGYVHSDYCMHLGVGQ